MGYILKNKKTKELAEITGRMRIYVEKTPKVVKDLSSGIEFSMADWDWVDEEGSDYGSILAKKSRTDGKGVR
jgi:hypothetical protein